MNVVELNEGTDLDNLLKSQEIETHLVRVSPTVSQYILDSKNTNNRKIKTAKILTLSRSMANGDWIDFTSLLQFDTNGVTVDGQHRYHGGVQAEYTFGAVLVTNVPTASRAVTDTGAVRSFADVLRMSGHETNNIHASAAYLLYRYDHDMMIRGHSRLSTNAELLSYYENHLDEALLQQLSSKSEEIYKSTTGFVPSALTALLYLIARNHPEMLNDFIRDVSTGAGLEERDPVLTLRNWAAKTMTTKNRLGVFHLAIYTKAFNARLLGKAPSTFVWRLTEVQPKML